MITSNFILQTAEETQAGGTSSGQHGQDSKSEGVQAGGTLTSSKSSATSTRAGKEHLQHMPKSVDYGDGNDSVSTVQVIKVGQISCNRICMMKTRKLITGHESLLQDGCHDLRKRAFVLNIRP